ncbi:YggS family pyridoxal phosphate-dependent enzyme [Gallaecimonas kandeliae]|uniref:YggS family pyridoxal phosphate-dependent enzyme n=1 Tax=Gallaecimonas kandeliae TaxID=3029055 RepID=UPI002648DDDA|nr:YggS family pyridoxal phosphate-dependent enzyme [Gallaecimonas kandeliae]WKE66178.1 YggS family pyridoxal phosphate-dependent enzyme [Gallaecimonas kandeliae]
MTTIAERLSAVSQRIKAAAQDAGRNPDSVTLLAVSKRKPLKDIEAALALGLRAFGENYVREGVEKIQGLAQSRPGHGAQWHYIGPIQSNKTAPIAEHFDWVQSLDRAKLAQRLNDQRPSHLNPLQICIQVNISGESSKSGLAPEEVETLAALVASLPHLELRGLMAIPKATDDQEEQHRQFAAMKALFDRLKEKHPQIDTLSMGMSGDLEAAIMEGATMVRLGTALFGTRTD